MTGVTDIEMDTLEARCGHCGKVFDHPDPGELSYGLFVFCSENGRVYAYCEAIANPVARLVDVLLPENRAAGTYESALAELADPMLGQKLRTRIRCPNCATTDLDYWGGKKTGSMWVKPATYTDLLSLPRSELIRKISGYVSKEISWPWPDPEVPTFDPDGRMVPPWVKYPNLPKGSMGWRMGQGEWYIDEFRRWYYSRPREERVEFMNTYDEPEDWKGFYRWRR